MKKVLFATVAIAALSLGSCKKCVDCSGVAGTGTGSKICESDYNATGAQSTLSWSSYKSALIAAGCKAA